MIAVFLELGRDDTRLLRDAMRSWVAFAEEMLVESVADGGDSELADSELVEFLTRSAVAVASAVDPAGDPAVGPAGDLPAAISRAGSAPR